MPLSNGNRVSRPLKPGIYTPIPSFFLPESEDLGQSLSLLE
jgi:4-hydroxy-2-oxoglutarate aldolase